MPQMTMSIPHQLSQQEASARIRKLLHTLREEHAGRVTDLREAWTDEGATFSFSAMGFAVSGSLAVTSADVRLAAELPFAASLFRSQIEGAIRERAAALLA